MIVINDKTYSEAYVANAISMALAAGIKDEDTNAGKKSSCKNGISVVTPIGEMTAYTFYEDGQEPGIGVDIILADSIVALGTFEVDTIKNNALNACVFADTDDEWPSDMITYYGNELNKLRTGIV